MSQLGATHRFMSRISGGLWGGAIGYSLPFMFALFSQVELTPETLTLMAYPAMFIFGWIGQHYLHKLLRFPSVEYTSQFIPTSLRIKTVCLFLFIASVVFSITPALIKSAQQSILPLIIYALSLSLLAWFYGVQLLLLKPMPRTLLKSLAIGFNCFSWQNALGLTLASFYYGNYNNIDKFLKFASFQYLTFMLYPLIVGMFLSMLSYYFNNKQ